MGTATDTLVVVRCRYCVLGDEFKPMVAHQDGRCICSKCGHLANPYDQDCVRARRVLTEGCSNIEHNVVGDSDDDNPSQFYQR